MAVRDATVSVFARSGGSGLQGAAGRGETQDGGLAGGGVPLGGLLVLEPALHTGVPHLVTVQSVTRKTVEHGTMIPSRSRSSAAAASPAMSPALVTPLAPSRMARLGTAADTG